MCRQQISFSWWTAPPALAKLTSSWWRASWQESSSHLPTPSVPLEYVLGPYSTATPPGDWQDSDFRQLVLLRLQLRTFTVLVLFFRVEFSFSSYLNGTQLVNAVQNLNYKGGNTRTGAGLKYVADNLFNSASRRDVPKVCRGNVSSTHFVFSKQLAW